MFQNFVFNLDWTGYYTFNEASIECHLLSFAVKTFLALTFVSSSCPSMSWLENALEKIAISLQRRLFLMIEMIRNDIIKEILHMLLQTLPSIDTKKLKLKFSSEIKAPLLNRLHCVYIQKQNCIWKRDQGNVKTLAFLLPYGL